MITAETPCDQNQDERNEDDHEEEVYDEAARTWSLGRNLGLYTDNGEEVLPSLATKILQRPEKKKSRTRRKGRAGRSASLGKPNVSSNSKCNR